MKPNTQEWEKEFDDRFVLKSDKRELIPDGEHASNALKSFICFLLSQHTEAMVKELEGMKFKNFKTARVEVLANEARQLESHNLALDSAITKIREMNKKR